MFGSVIFILDRQQEQDPEQEKEAKTICFTLPRGVASYGEEIQGGWGLIDERSKTTIGEDSAVPKL